MADTPESVPFDVLSVGATRPAVIKGLNVPFWFILPIIGLPVVVVVSAEGGDAAPSRTDLLTVYIGPVTAPAAAAPRSAAARPGPIPSPALKPTR
jgi:hypothetical protein